MADENLFRYVSDTPGEDINVLPSEGHGQLHSADTGEVLEMVLGDDDLLFGDDDITVGRLPQGGAGDVSEFDYLPPLEADIDPEDENNFLGDDPEVFSPPPDDQFPVFRHALRKFTAAEAKPKVVRIDTEESHDQFMCERAVAEISRRVDELQQALKHHEDEDRALLEAHEHDPDAHSRKSDVVVGAAQAVANLSAAQNAKDVAESMPKVPIDVPAFAEGKIKCWKDGNNIVCSIRFMAADGKGRVATMSARPKADADDVARHAVMAGVDPITIFGALEDLADVACGKRLVKEVAGAALKAHRRLDVCGMAKDGTDDPSLGDDPVFLVTGSDSGSAPIAALMHVEQRAKAGDKQAHRELTAIRGAAATHGGRALAPVVAEASARLRNGQKQKSDKLTLAQRYAGLSLML